MENKGLTSAQAAELIKIHGENRLPTGKKRRLVTIIWEQFKDCMVLVLIAAAVVSAFMGEFTEAFTVLGIVLANALLGTVQSWRTEKAVAALSEMTAPGARVIRDGAETKISASRIVPGDIMAVSAGDRIGADGEILFSSSLAVDESMLTGESLPAEKTRGEKVFMGTMAVKGNARVLVTGTGGSTEMGRIAGMIDSAENRLTPLQLRLKTLGKTLLLCCLFVCAGVSVTGYLRGEDLLTMFLSGVSLAVAAIPEGLPAVVTVSLALGVTKMSKRSAMIRRMPAVETLGCVEVICSDKTGTLTENKMRLSGLWSPAGGAEEDALLLTAALSSEGEAVETKGRLNVTGDATERALLSAGAKRGIFAGRQSGLRQVCTHVFSSERKRMSKVWRDKNGALCSRVKGAPEYVLPRCSYVMKNSVPVALTHGLRREIMDEMKKMAAGGQRVIALAAREALANSSEAEAESSLTFLGLAGLMDPPRAEAKAAVARAKKAGIRTVMITGDSPETAGAIAGKLDILAPGGKVVTGAELEGATDGELEELCKNAAVFARVAPVHKHRIVKAMKKLGLVTAMTGDGVNDAPAVREADVGIAMGISGTDVTREAADVVLADDNFSSIVDAVAQGRMIYDNIRKFLRYMLSSNLGEVLTMFAAILLVLPMPLLPVHILLVNLVTDGLPAMALGMDGPDGDVMELAPRGKNEGVFARGLGLNIVFRGIFIALGTLGVYWFALERGLETARTAAFVTLAASQLFFVFECRSEKRGMFSPRIFSNLWLVGAVAISAGVMLASVYVPPLAAIFGFEPMSGGLLGIAVGVAFGGAVVSSLANIFLRCFRKKEKRDLLFGKV